MRSISPLPRAAAWIAISCAIPAACAPTTATVATDPLPPVAVACRAFAPIEWSAKDTDDTIRQAKGHNAAHAALCGEASRGHP